MYFFFRHYNNIRKMKEKYINNTAKPVNFHSETKAERIILDTN